MLALSIYLSELSLTNDDEEICLPERDIPEGFHLIYNRCCKRSQYEITAGFTIILSKERSWRSDAITEETRESVYIVLHSHNLNYQSCSLSQVERKMEVGRNLEDPDKRPTL